MFYTFSYFSSWKLPGKCSKCDGLDAKLPDLNQPGGTKEVKHQYTKPGSSQFKCKMKCASKINAPHNLTLHIAKHRQILHFHVFFMGAHNSDGQYIAD